MLQKRLGAALVAWLLLAATPAWAGACPGHYVDGRLPEIRNAKLAAATRELCFGVFGVMHSGVTRTPLWSAEFLRAGNLRSARELTRENSFHPEPQLPPSQRAELADYARSGFDRGHMAPNGDMPDRESQRESFTLANMVPQDADVNRHVWAAIEGVVRKMAQKEGELYVITGPAFIGARLRRVGNVMVPSHVYKLVYSPRRHAGAAWIIENQPNAESREVSIAQLEAMVAIDLLPSLSQRQKEAMLPLPAIKRKKAAYLLRL